jgi:hypothetical protein
MNISKQDVNIKFQDSVRLKSDTSAQQLQIPADTFKRVDTVQVKKVTIPAREKIFENIDNTVLCKRNYISDVTFHDTANIITRIDKTIINGFPALFIEKNKLQESEARELRIAGLKEGNKLPVHLFHDDWIIIVLLSAAFLYSSIRTFSKRLFPDVIKFFLFRGIGDPSAMETRGLFQLQSTLTNLISFFNIALFAYCAALYFDFISFGISRFMVWLIAFGIIVIAVTLRHIICFILGRASGEKEAFDEYLLTIYQSYRFTAIILFILVILLVYSSFLPTKLLILTGFIAIAIFYSMRIIRLFMIFIKRNISILYLILYLCALEFLPVVISVKYFTGLF